MLPPLGRKKSFFKRRPVWITAVVIVVLVIIVAVLELTNTTYIFHKRPQPLTASPATKGVPANDSGSNDIDQSDQKQPTQATSNNVVGSNIDTNQTLNAPTGPFVSNHFPNLSGSPAPNTINSVCNTTSGATCQISFTKGSVTKSLPAEVTDKGGAAYWNGWKIQDIGLTAGEWQITVKATLGSQTKTASDSLNLKVSP